MARGGPLKQNTSKSHKSKKSGGKPRRSPSSGPSTALTKAQGSAPDTSRPLSFGQAKDVADASIDTGIIQEEPAKQWWYRKPDSKARKLAEKIAVADAAGLPDKEIAKKLKTTEGTIKVTRYLAKKNGWWDSEDEPIDLDTEMALSAERKAVRNLNAGLDGKMTNWQTHELTMATLKGRGLLRNHEAAKSDQGASVGMIGIQIIMPPMGAGDQKVEIPDTMVGGVPAFIDGEVSDGRDDGRRDLRQLVPVSGGPGAGEDQEAKRTA